MCRGLVRAARGVRHRVAVLCVSQLDTLVALGAQRTGRMSGKRTLRQQLAHQRLRLALVTKRQAVPPERRRKQPRVGGS